MDTESPWLPARTSPRCNSRAPLGCPLSYTPSNGEQQNTLAFVRRQNYATVYHQAGLNFRSAPAPTIFDPSLLETGIPIFQVNGSFGAAENVPEDTIPSNRPRYLNWPEPDVLMSPHSFGPGINRTERLGHDYLSAIDACHRRPATRPSRPWSPLPWDNIIHLSGCESQAPDLDLEARARQRSLMNHRPHTCLS